MPATKLSYKKDPLTDKQSIMRDLPNTFKGASVPTNPFKDAKPRTQIDEFYTKGAGKGTQRQ